MKFTHTCILLLSLLAVSCSSTKQTAGTGNSKKPVMVNAETFLLAGVSEDTTYGYSPANAIRVGGKSNLSGPQRERFYLNALMGPEKEMVVYIRKGSCCGVKSSHAPMGVAILDKYEVSYNGLEKPVMLYINMYDPGEMKAPKGFTFKSK